MKRGENPYALFPSMDAAKNNPRNPAMRMTVGRALIASYKRRWLFIPGKHWAKYDVLYRAYSRWAADELMDRMQQSPHTDPIRITEEFVAQMDAYYEKSSCEACWQLFGIARDAGKDILDLLRENERRRNQYQHAAKQASP